MPLLLDGVNVVAGTERLSYLAKNTIITDSMVVHVPRKEANATCINPVGHPIHNDSLCCVMNYVLGDEWFEQTQNAQ